MRFFVLENNEMQNELLCSILRALYKRAEISSFQAKDSALSVLDKDEYDMYFVDIELDNDNFGGIKFVKELIRSNSNVSKKVIFISGHKKYAITAINETHCYGYLLKPYNKIEILNTIEKCLKDNSSFNDPDSMLKFKIRGNINYVNRKSIIYVDFFNKKPMLHLPTHTIEMPRMTIENVLSELNKDGVNNFVRIRRNYIINISHLSHVVNRDSIYYVIFKNAIELPIGNKYKDELFRTIGSSD